MAQPKWVRNAVKWHGQFLKRKSTQQPSRSLGDREMRLFAFCRAKDERESREYLRIAAEGTEEEVERAYHRIVGGSPETVMAVPLDAIQHMIEHVPESSARH